MAVVKTNLNLVCPGDVQVSGFTYPPAKKSVERIKKEATKKTDGYIYGILFPFRRIDVVCRMLGGHRHWLG